MSVFRGEDGGGQVQGFLRPIDTAEIARRLKLDEAAAHRGSRELPATDAQSLDSIEQQITQALESEWSWNGADLINNLRAYAARLIAVSVQTEFATLDLLAQNALTKLGNAHHRAEAELGPLSEAYISSRQELDEFRRRNRLKRSARNPSRRWTTAGLLVVIVGIESTLNGVFFAKGAQFGLLGGIGTAIGISFANVVVSFAIGLFPMRWINHRNYILKLLGLLLTILGFFAIIGVHGFAAHFRDATALVGEDRALAVAIKSLHDTPFVLADLNSFYLFGIGIILAITAMWKGYAFDDPYPKYGAHFRRMVDARETYSDEHSFLFDDLEDIKEDTVRAIDAGIKRIPLFPQQAASIKSQRESLLQAFRGYETSVESAANQLLARYRDANRSNRETPAPRYFDEKWKLPHSYLTDVSVLTIVAESTTPPMDPNEALEKLRIMAETVLSEYNSLIVKYPHPTQMK
jgi:hypothetical protein